MTETDSEVFEDVDRCPTCGWEMGVGDHVETIVASDEARAAGESPATIVTDWVCMNPDCPDKAKS